MRSILTRTGQIGRAVANCLSFPPTLAHELSHYAVARAATDDAAFRAEVFGGEAVAVWRPIENPLVRFLAFLAPTLLGTPLILWWISSGVALDGWRLLVTVGLALYTVPSPADVRGALGLQAAQNQE